VPFAFALARDRAWGTRGTERLFEERVAPRIAEVRELPIELTHVGATVLPACFKVADVGLELG
jgi:hypothetical protein